MNADDFSTITRVHDVVQQNDGRFRLDIWIDNRMEHANHVASVLQDQLPHRWHTRRHIPYRERHFQRGGIRRAPQLINQPQGLTVASWNIRSFWPKKKSILWFLKLNSVDILCLQETHCNAESWAPKLHGYTVYSVPSGQHGEVGLALAIRKHIRSTILEQTNHWIIAEIRMEDGIFIVANIYFPSGGLNHSVIRDFDQSLERYAVNISRSRVLILGDFNRIPAEVDQLCWRWSAPVTRLITRGSPGSFHGFRPQMEPTAIDHILFGPSIPAQPRVKVLRGWSDSDHWPIIVTLPVHLGVPSSPIPKKVYSRTFSDIQKLEFLSDNRWDVLVNQLSGDLSVEAATTSVLDTFNAVGHENQVIVESMGPSDKALHLSHASRCAINHRTRALNNFLASGNEEQRTMYIRKKAEARRLLQEDAKRRWNRRLEQLREAVGGHQTKRVWTWMNNFLKPQRFTQNDLLPAIFDQYGVLQTSEQGKDAAWLAYYRRLFDDPSGHSRDPIWWAQFRPTNTTSESLDPLSSPITSLELLNLLGKLQNGKAPGIDKIPPEWFKILRFRSRDQDNSSEFPNKAAQALCFLYQSMLQTSTVPECWRTSEIVSIPKSGDLQRPENYRGIALIPVALKILCAMVINRFNQIVEERHLVRPEQAGFRRREECIGQVTSLLEITTRRRTLGERTYLAFIDLKKAYDMVPHEALFAKLAWAGFDGTFLSFLRALYEDVRMNPRGTSVCVPALRGLRQGCPMSPSLFNFFINDFFDPIGNHEATGVSIPQNDGTLLHIVQV